MINIDATNQSLTPNYFSSFDQDLDQNLFLSLSPKELLALSSTSREWRQRVLSTTHSIAEQIFRTWDLSECQGSLGGFKLLLLYQKAKTPHLSPMSVPLSIVYEERNSEITDRVKTIMLAFACISQSLQSCHILLKNGVSLNPPPGFPTSPVVIAAHTGNIPLLNALIDHGIDQESLNSAFYSMITEKLTFSGTVTHFKCTIDDVNHEICKLLLKKGAYPSDSITLSPAHFLVHAVLNKDAELCQLLIDHYGAAVYDRNYSMYLGTIDDCLFERSYHSSMSLREHYSKCYQVAKILLSQKPPTPAMFIVPAAYALICIGIALLGFEYTRSS